FPGEEAPVHAAVEALVRVERLLAHRQDAEARRQHEALLRTGDASVNAPLAHAHVERTNRRNAIDEKKRGMLGVIEGLAHAGDIGGNARRGFVMRGEDGLDLVVLILSEDIRILFERNARSPLFVAKFDFEAEALGHVDPEKRELSEAAHENLVADGERILD